MTAVLAYKLAYMHVRGSRLDQKYGLQVYGMF
jgi:hypothetical protein